MTTRDSAMIRPGNGQMEIRSPKNRVLAALMCFFFGVFGVHRFYVGKFWTGLFQFFTGGGFGVWFIIDFILILMGRFKDGEGRVLGPPDNQRSSQRNLPPTRNQQSEPRTLPSQDERDGSIEGPEDVDEDLLADPLEKEFEELEKEMSQKETGS